MSILMFFICPSLWPEPVESDKILLIQHIYIYVKLAAVRYTGMSRETTSPMHTSIHTPHYFSHINIHPFVFCDIKVDLASPLKPTPTEIMQAYQELVQTSS